MFYFFRALTVLIWPDQSERPSYSPVTKVIDGQIVKIEISYSFRYFVQVLSNMHTSLDLPC